jgi:hypothetical protein
MTTTARGQGDAPPLVQTCACVYQTSGHLQGGEEVLICTLAEGSCPLQECRPLMGGRRVAVCLLPPCGQKTRPDPAGSDQRVP